MFGEHASFIIPSYVITFFCLAGMATIIRYTYAKRVNEMRELEEQGLTRAPSKPTEDN